jgi:hypothetical protein
MERPVPPKPPKTKNSPRNVGKKPTLEAEAVVEVAVDAAEDPEDVDRARETLSGHLLLRQKRKWAKV